MPAPLAIAAIAAGGFIQGGGLGGIIGGRGRRREEEEARLAQREAQYDYENFDFDQDVGPIRNPYSEAIKQQTEFAQQNIDRTSANQLEALQRAGRFGGAQAVITAQADAAQRANQSITQLRTQGALYVDKRRQDIINQRYGRTETLLARSEHRLAAARRARQVAQEKLFKGIGAGVQAGFGAAGAGKGATFAARLKASGLVGNNFNVPGAGNEAFQKYRQGGGTFSFNKWSELYPEQLQDGTVAGQ